MFDLHHGGGPKKRHNLPSAIAPVALTQYIENKNTNRRSYHTSVLEKEVSYHFGQANDIPGNSQHSNWTSLANRTMLRSITICVN